jgi:hypothetical protein
VLLLKGPLTQSGYPVLNGSPRAMGVVAPETVLLSWTRAFAAPTKARRRSIVGELKARLVQQSCFTSPIDRRQNQVMASVRTARSHVQVLALPSRSLPRSMGICMRHSILFHYRHILHPHRHTTALVPRHAHRSLIAHGSSSFKLPPGIPRDLPSVFRIQNFQNSLRLLHVPEYLHGLLCFPLRRTLRQEIPLVFNGWPKRGVILRVSAIKLEHLPRLV